LPPRLQANAINQGIKAMTGRTVRLAVFLLGAMVLSGCASTFKATHDSDPGHDFSGYRNWAWINANPMTVGATERIPNPLLESRIMDSVENALRTKGYTKVADPEAADFVVAFTVGSREEIKVDSYPTMSAGYGYPGRWGGAYYGGYYGGTQTTVRQYTKGTLAIDIFDIKTHKPVWHGSATKSIYDSDRENLEATVNDAVGAIIDGYPLAQ
jgi:uncharacterized protein YceK